METSKPWYASRTIWAGAVMVILGVGQVLGIIGSDQASALLVSLPDTIMGIVNGLLGALAIQGRVAADKKIE